MKKNGFSSFKKLFIASSLIFQSVFKEFVDYAVTLQKKQLPSFPHPNPPFPHSLFYRPIL
ncbi:MAG: hypothetical protein V7655_08885 [Aequorivita antarctica]